MLDFGNGWWMSGVRAIAKIEVAGTIQHISSAGLWGIESDSDDGYIKGVAGDELSALIEILTDLNGGNHPGSLPELEQGIDCITI